RLRGGRGAADRPGQRQCYSLVRGHEGPPQRQSQLRSRRWMMAQTNTEFEFCGVNHLALVCKDMARTVEFYRDTLGMPLTKTIDLPGGRGQHFFFDIGNGDSLAFFWFPDAPEAAPGVSAPAALPTQ